MMTPWQLSIVSAAMIIGCGAAQQPTAPAPDISALADGYLDALEAGDLDSAASLFGVHSSIVETGRHEGDWERYASHHLGPELGAIRSFELQRRPLEVGKAEGLAFAIVAIESRMLLRDGRTIDSTAVVTFIADRRGLRHIHWSSRPRSTPSAAHAHQGSPDSPH